jgi:hypothetical protein
MSIPSTPISPGTPPRAEISHDGEALSNAIWGYPDTKPLIYTRKYTIYMKSGIRDLVPKLSLTLRFDLRANHGQVCIARADLPILKPHLTKLIPAFPDILDSLSECHVTYASSGNGNHPYDRQPDLTTAIPVTVTQRRR